MTGSAEPASRSLPYTGHLDMDGVPFSGTAQLQFTLYDTREGPQAEIAPWVECHPLVAVHNGAFTVRLGDPAGVGAVPSDLTPVLVQDRQYYLEIAVRRLDPVANPDATCGPEGGPFTTFPTRQKLAPVPQAMNALVAPVPPGAVMFFALPLCPSGWVPYDPARGRYLVGVQPGGTLAGASGQPLGDLESRPVGEHSHNVWDPGHTHEARDLGHQHGISSASSDSAGGTNDYGNNFHHTNYTDVGYARIVNTPAATGIGIFATGVPGTPAPYLQLLPCIKQ